MKSKPGLLPAFLMLLLSIGAFLGTVQAAWAQGPHIDIITVDGVINPVTAGYVARGIRTAENDGATCLILQLDTPGGLSSSMGDMMRDILNAEVPVIVYITPRGARAASAGVYITYASHLAAMAPNTHIGAATPVAVGEDGQVVEMPEAMQRKIEEDALAQLRATAQERGRNWEWAEQAVREAASATAREALDLGVVEILADDLGDLLDQLDGRAVTLASGMTVTLQTSGVLTQFVPMNAIDRLLLVITEPTVAYLLLSLGGLGLWIEFSKPGVQLPGVLGAVCILVALYSLGTLPVNWTGVFLILFAFILFAFDIFATTHLVLTTGGIVSFVMGSLLLFSSEPYLRIPVGLIAAVAGSLGIVVVLILFAVIRGHRQPVVSGQEGLIGMVGEVRRPLDPEGLVFVDGALWKARAENEAVAAGEQVEVVGVEGLCLHVRRRL